MPTEPSAELVRMVVLLAAAALAVPLFRRPRLGSVLYYVLASVVIGQALARAPSVRGPLKVSNVSSDVRCMHRERALVGALFQVASQFNALEMVGPHVTPEHGVTRYADDPTQDPACAVAAGATPAEVDAWCDLLRIGVHRDAEVTDASDVPRPTVSQAVLLGTAGALHADRSAALTGFRDAGA